MKKQILLIAVIISALSFVSCRKDALDSGIGQTSSSSDLTTPTLIYLDPLKVGLEGLYKFNGDLKDATGLLAAGVPTGPGLTFTTDRKGVANSAIQFTGSYGFDIPSLKMQPNTSICAWVKYDSMPSSIIRFVQGAISGGPSMGQQWNKYFASISTPGTTSVITPAMDNNWHYLVVTYDGIYLKLYVDGNFLGLSNNPMSYSYLYMKYLVGYTPSDYGTLYWKGRMDDLRFYTRALSSKDILALYNL